MIRIERRLEQPLWLSVAVPFASVAFSFLVIAAVLAITGHDPITTYRRVFDSAFVGSQAWTYTLVSATPLLFTGLAAAVAFRMQLYNIGAEGQLYIGAICGAGAAIWPVISAVSMWNFRPTRSCCKLSCISREMRRRSSKTNSNRCRSRKLRRLCCSANASAARNDKAK